MEDQWQKFIVASVSVLQAPEHMFDVQYYQ